MSRSQYPHPAGRHDFSADVYKRQAEGRVMQFFCDVEKPDNTPFGGNCRGFLRDINRRFKQLGLRCNVGTE